MYSCDICGDKVMQKKSLTRHKKIVHYGVKYTCKQCSKEFTDKGTLAEHQRAVH